MCVLTPLRIPSQERAGWSGESAPVEEAESTERNSCSGDRFLVDMVGRDLRSVSGDESSGDSADEGGENGGRF